MTDTPTPDKISELFDEAALDKSIDSPGVDGLVDPLQQGMTDYTILPQDVRAAYEQLHFAVDCSFTSDTLSNSLPSFLQTILLRLSRL